MSRERDGNGDGGIRERESILRTISHQVNVLSAEPAGIILKKFCVYIDIYSSTIERVSRKTH